MISKEFKEFTKKVKQLNIVELPYSIVFDKVTGKPKASGKNLQVFELIDALLKLKDDEFTSLFRNRYKQNSSEFDEAAEYLMNNAGKRFDKYYLQSLINLTYDYRKKVEAIEAKRARDAKKAGIEVEKQKLLLTLNRKDIADSINKIKKSMNPYIRKAEESIAETLNRKEKEFISGWEDIQRAMEVGGVEVIRPSSNIESTIAYSSAIIDGKKTTVKDYIRQKHSRFFHTWMDSKGYRLNTSATYFSNGNTSKLISQTQTQFRDSQEYKVEVLFHRLLKTNPTLKNYQLAVPYNGTEFTLTANNEKSEQIRIQTNTIQAGGYNIQRLHTRWLVDIKNTVTGKGEKFTIDDKTKA
jgi:hypothetical protein